jgi:nucleoside-diphosphate-sugar epimerase
MKRVAVFGASGFVGATLVEQFSNSREIEVAPIIHSAGNAWRLARLGLDLQQVDILSKAEVDNAIRGCTHVVNCTRGDDAVMLKGLKNLLDASVRHKVRRFVHLSSVMVYGDPPLAENEDSTIPRMPKGTYARTKQVQDGMVRSAARHGLSSVVLVPPNISGVHSEYLAALVNLINAGQFVLMDGGRCPCNLVDVCNLTWAIELALSEGSGDGSRYFVTDGGACTWADVISDLERLKVTKARVGHVTREALENVAPVVVASRPSLIRSMTHLVSSDIREALRKDPLWKKLDMTLRGWIAKLGSSVEEPLRLWVEGPLPVVKRASIQQFDRRLCSHQLRDVRHSIDKARRELGYRPRYSYRESMDAFMLWYRQMHALDSQYVQLYQQLYV